MFKCSDVKVAIRIPDVDYRIIFFYPELCRHMTSAGPNIAEVECGEIPYSWITELRIKRLCL